MSLVVAILGAFLAARRPWLFDPYFGGLPPILALVGKIFRSWALESQIGLCIVAVASLEAVFQLSQATRNLAVFTAIHLLLFGLVELYIFRRFDFVSMYAFRIIYYAYWHVAWGHARLMWLF